LKRPNPGLIVVLAATAAIHLSVAALDFSTLARNGFLYDDSFYAFQIARHIAHGDGPTFDGTHLTNGFQPLYVATLVPMYLAAGDDATAPVHAALVLSALLTVATAWLLYRLVARRASETAALIAAGAWAFSPIVTRQAANGLETALALFLLASATLYYVERVRPVVDAPRRRFVVWGALLALAFLARADLGLLGLAMGLDYLLVLRARGVGPRWRGNLGAAFATGALICAPWILYGALAVGSPIPESGRATRFLSVAYAPFFGLGPSSMLQSGPTLTFVGEHVEHSFGALKVIPVLHPFFRATQKLSMGSPDAGIVAALANAIGLLVLAGFVAWWFRRRRSPRGQSARDYDFLLLFAVILIAAYSTVIFGMFFFLRYYYPLYFVAMVFAGIAADDLIASMRRSPAIVRRAVLAGSGVYAAGLLFMAYTAAYRTTPVYGFYDAARWVATHTDASDTIGVFQGGAIGYLSHRHVVNLDGKVNGEAFRALRDGRLGAYVQTAGIDFVMDSEQVLDRFLGPWSDDERHKIENESVFAGDRNGVPGWIGYRVSPPRVFDARGPKENGGAGSMP
jgi:4-amino-4-deoxy-L-arabinose transferase-like glycosyltransferase